MAVHCATRRIQQSVPKRPLDRIHYYYCCCCCFTEVSQQSNGPNASRLVESLLGSCLDRVHVEQFAVTASVLPPTRSAHLVKQVSQHTVYCKCYTFLNTLLLPLSASVNVSPRYTRTDYCAIG